MSTASIDQWVQPPPAAPEGPGYYSRAATRLASYPNIALGVVIALVVVIISMVVYYRGLWFLGPYAGAPPKRARLQSRRDDEEEEEQPAGDAETERLIESITRT